MANKKELAQLAIKLFDNIDQADQFNTIELFYHLDNAFLLHLIEDMYDCILKNEELGCDFKTMTDDEFEAVMNQARKILKNG